MQNLPFRLLVTNDLDLQNAVRLDHHELHPPGTVDESNSRSVWTSKLNGSYPQELGLLVLSAQSVTIQALRLTVGSTRAPAQIAIFAALPPPLENKLKPTSSSLDAVSRYLSSVWEPCCEPLFWEGYSSARRGSRHDVNTKTARLHLTQCSFLKLVVHASSNKIGNEPRQVAIEDIELRGTTQNLNLDQEPRSPLLLEDSDKCSNHSAHFDRIRRSILPLPTKDMDDLQTVLLEAGVSMDLVAQVVSFQQATNNADPVCLSPMDQVDKLSLTNLDNLPDSKRMNVPDATTLSRQGSSEVQYKDAYGDQPISPFDILLRQHVEQIARETALLEDILATRIRKSADEVFMWQSPTISSCDPANITEITIYTFGNFFTQCLLCGGSDIQTTCIQMAEHYACLLKESIGATAAFEGIIAVIALSLRKSKSSQVFQGAIHFAHTVFMAAAMPTAHQLKFVGDKPDTCSKRSDTTPTNESSTLGLIEELAHCNWSYGLGIVLGSTIANPFCWNATSHTNMKLKSRISAPPSIDREFLQFIRMLLEQELTRESFFEELLHVDMQSAKNENDATSPLTINRLRLLRLILRNERYRYKIPENVKESIHTLCNSYVDERDSSELLDNEGAVKQYDRNAVPTRLAWDCLDELERLTLRPNNGGVTSPKKLLTTVRSKLEGSEHPNSYHSQRHHHTALCIHDPLRSSEVEECIIQMKRYFSTQPRPIALYRHSFVRGSLIDAEKNPAECHKVFQKGNIAFRGQVVPRALPTTTFHEKIKRKTMPFVFDDSTLSNENPNQLPQHSQQSSKREIVSSFAEFRGAIERRSDTPKRSSRVVPQRTPAIVKSLSTTLRNQLHDDPVSHANSLVNNTTDPKNLLQHFKERTPRSRIEQVHQAPVVTQPAPINSLKTPLTTSRMPQLPENQLGNIPPRAPDVPKTKGTSKGRATSKANAGGKDHDNCTVQ